MTGIFTNFLTVTPQLFTTNGVGENTNVSLGSSLLHVTPAADGDFISGFVPVVQYDGIMLWLWNVDGANTLLLKAGGSASGYRILVPSGSTQFAVQPSSSIWLRFSQGLGWQPQRQAVLT